MTELKAGTVTVTVTDTQDEMGRITADEMAAVLKRAAGEGMVPVLWLMAAPSAFPFYEEFLARATDDQDLRETLKLTHFFQFDDYPIPRGSEKFPVTFRHLLETRFFAPLERITGNLPYVHYLELTGTGRDDRVMKEYRNELLRLRSGNSFFAELKGIGMDGHWGFHGPETPHDAPADIIRVPMNALNIRQQRLDWPRYFANESDVPRTAVTFTVGMFFKADLILDNVPQPSKEYAVLAAYGTDDILDEIPSSALKKHPGARSFVTAEAARALLEFREGRRRDPGFRLPSGTLSRLDALWTDPDHPETGRTNREAMRAVLGKLGMIG